MTKHALIFLIVATCNTFLSYSKCQNKVRIREGHYNYRPQKVVVGFLYWYKQNRHSLQSIKIVDGEVADITKSYKVHLGGVNKYITKLKSSNKLSDIFLSDIKLKFSNLEKRLQENPVYGGPIDELTQLVNVEAYLSKVKGYWLIDHLIIRH